VVIDLTSLARSNVADPLIFPGYPGFTDSSQPGIPDIPAVARAAVAMDQKNTFSRVDPDPATG
jgi:hypothetical protein